MALLKDHTYKLVFNVGGQILTFTGTIIEDDGKLILFKDKYGEQIEYNREYYVSGNEVQPNE